jgi:hypothetical protein
VTSDQAYLADVNALRSLADCVSHLPGHISRAIQEAEADAAPRLRRLERAAERAREYLRQAEDAYHSASDEDRDEAYDALQEARDRVSRIEGAVDRVRNSLRRYKSCARDLDEARRGLLMGASGYLSERILAVERYLALRPDGNATPVRSASVGASGAAGDLYPLQSMVDTPLPKGFMWVPIAEIVEPLPVDPSEWKKGTSKEEMQIGLNTFRRDMMPIFARGDPAAHDDFRALDQKLGRMSSGPVRADSLMHLYEVFFGGDPIAVDRGTGGKGFSVNSGRHRISVAKELGWTHVPARLLGKHTP